MAEWLIDRFPPHKRYVEVFFGGGHVFWQKGLASENVINDLNKNLVTLYQVISNEIECKALKIRLRNCIYSRDLFDDYLELYGDKVNFPFLPKIERAFIFLFLNKTSFNGEFNHFASRPDAHGLYNIESSIDIVHKKIRAGNAVIENCHFRDILKKYDSENTFMYLDPPYWVTTKTEGKKYYEKTMSIDEHSELYDLLKAAKCKWLMSYDDEDIIRKIYEEFHIVQTPVLHQPSATGSGKIVFKSEIIIANFNIETSGTLFDT
jgi:DNA adenine methylase